MMRITKLRSKALVTFTAALMFALIAMPVLSQERVGAVNGVVTDQTGAVLPGVSITITNTVTKRAFTTVTDGNGTYAARTLEPGRYDLSFELARFNRAELKDINVLLGQALKVDINLTVAGQTQQVEVIETAPQIDTQNVLIAHNVTAEEFNLLPKSRTFQYFAAAAPAVNTGEVEGGIQVNGASGAENVFNIDGITTNSGINGASRQNAAFEYLSEV